MCTTLWKSSVIKAQTRLEFIVNGRNVKSTAFIQPESEIPCLLGMIHRRGNNGGTGGTCPPNNLA